MTITAALIVFGCSLILDFEVGTWDCWCGERWETTIYGAQANAQGGEMEPIAPELTTHIACVSMLDHLVLDMGDPNSAAYQAIVDGFELQAIANCEATAADVPNMTNNNCDTNQVNFATVHNGACWREANFDEGDCSQHAAECIGKYDCTDPWITAKDGGGETGGDEAVWECDEDPGAGAGETGGAVSPIEDRPLASPR